MSDQDESAYNNAPDSNLYTRIDNILWGDCNECRLIRFGLVAGSVITNVITWAVLFAT